MKTINYLEEGTKVFYFCPYCYKVKESIISDVNITFEEKEPMVTYTMGDSHKRGDVKLTSDKVFEDKEKLKKTLLENFEN